MQLRELQTGLYDLIKSGTTNESDDYFEMLRHANNIHVVRKVALWWRHLHITEFCTLTTAWLKYEKKLDQAVASFFYTQKYSPYRKEVGMQFLMFISTTGSGFIKTIADFELALIKVKSGMKVSLVQRWPFEPYYLLNRLLNSTVTNSSLVKGEYCVTLSSDFYPELFHVQVLESDEYPNANSK
jgi:hypothetical protein